MPEMPGRWLWLVQESSMTAAVTVPRKRCTTRVIECAVCRTLHVTSRSDSITCSNGCRVALHRKPELADQVRSMAKSADVPLAFLLEFVAMTRLVPELSDPLQSTDLEIEDCRPMVYDALMTRVTEILRKRSTTGD